MHLDIKKVKLSLYMPWRHTGAWGVLLHSFLTLILDGGERSAIQSGCFTHPLPNRERIPSTHWIEGWVGARTGLNVLEKNYISCTCTGTVNVLTGLSRLHSCKLKRCNWENCLSFWVEGDAAICLIVGLGMLKLLSEGNRALNSDFLSLLPLEIIHYYPSHHFLFFFLILWTVSKKFMIGSCISWYRLYILSVTYSFISRVGWSDILLVMESSHFTNEYQTSWRLQWAAGYITAFVFSSLTLVNTYLYNLC